MDSTLYKADFHEWLNQTVRLLENSSYEQVDWANLIEEVKELGESDKRAIRSNMIIIMLHLLKYIYQPEKKSDSWTNSIKEHRLRIELDVEASPSLKNVLEEFFVYCYQKARKEAVKQTGLGNTIFPESAPFTLEQIIGDWLPNNE